MTKKQERYYKTCEQCGETKQIASYFEKANTDDGYRKICAKCIKKNRLEANEKARSQAVASENIKKDKHKKNKPKADKALTQSCLQDEKLEDNKQSDKAGPIIEIIFTDREELYEKICNIAEERLRKPPDQILWWLINTDFDKLQNEKTSSD